MKAEVKLNDIRSGHERSEEAGIVRLGHASLEKGWQVLGSESEEVSLEERY